MLELPWFLTLVTCSDCKPRHCKGHIINTNDEVVPCTEDESCEALFLTTENIFDFHEKKNFTASLVDMPMLLQEKKRTGNKEANNCVLVDLKIPTPQMVLDTFTATETKMYSTSHGGISWDLILYGNKKGDILAV